MASEKKMSELEVLTRFSDKVEELHEELKKHPDKHLSRISNVITSAMGTEKKPGIQQESIYMAWERERDGIEPLPGDAAKLKKLRKEIPKADFLIRKFLHLTQLNFILVSSKKGLGVTDVMDALDACDSGDEKGFKKAVARALGNQKKPN